MKHDRAAVPAHTIQPIYVPIVRRFHSKLESWRTCSHQKSGNRTTPRQSSLAMKSYNLRARKMFEFLFSSPPPTSQSLQCTLSEGGACNPILVHLSTQENVVPIHTNFLFMLTVDRLYSIITKKGSTENNNCIKFGSRD